MGDIKVYIKISLCLKNKFPYTRQLKHCFIFAYYSIPLCSPVIPIIMLLKLQINLLFSNYSQKVFLYTDKYLISYCTEA